MTLVEDGGGGMRLREMHLMWKHTDRLEPKRHCGGSGVHPYLREASVDPELGRGLDILMPFATHQLGSLSLHFISLNLNLPIWKMESKLLILCPRQGGYDD